MNPDPSAWRKFWWHGVDIMVNAASSVLVATIIGIFWFAKKEYEIWFDDKKRAHEKKTRLEEEIAEILRQMHHADAIDDRARLAEDISRFFWQREFAGEYNDFFNAKWFMPYGSVARWESDNTWKKFCQECSSISINAAVFESPPRVWLRKLRSRLNPRVDRRSESGGGPGGANA